MGTAVVLAIDGLMIGDGGDGVGGLYFHSGLVASGAPRWRRAFADPIWSSAAIAGGGLAGVGTQGRFLEAVDAASGAPAFSVQLGGGAETEAAPAVVGACVVAATWGGVVALVC